ncbi:MAG TPA: DHHA1 domain-containing protein, partial [Dissulfurispiraceae bacterium]|nr:DHHA1 domain-containing protein [Dissulfurispiraceae bacterium]
QYRFLPCSELFHTFESLESAGIRVSDFSTLIILDCNDIERIGLEKKQQHPWAETLKDALSGAMTSIVIDHHETHRDFGDVKWIEPHAAATGLMVFQLLKAFGTHITAEIATNLYAAIVVDTGNFRFENATSQVFRVGAELIDCGARPHIVYQELFESWSEDRFRLYLKMIGTLDIREDVAFTLVTKKMMEETSTAADDTENFVSFPRIMKKIGMSALLRETGPNEYKVSLRSKGDINVARIAEIFDGGGHKNAAGCRIRADIETVKALILGNIRVLKNH